MRPKTLVIRKPGPFSHSLMHVKCSSSGSKSSSEPDVVASELVSSPDELLLDALVSSDESLEEPELPELAAEDESCVEEVGWFSLVVAAVDVDAALVVGAVLVAPVDVLDALVVALVEVAEEVAELLDVLAAPEVLSTPEVASSPGSELSPCEHAFRQKVRPVVSASDLNPGEAIFFIFISKILAALCGSDQE